MTRRPRVAGLLVLLGVVAVAGRVGAGSLQGLSVTVHTVRQGETLATLLAAFSTTKQTLEGQNPNLSLEALKPGDRVRILSRPGYFQAINPGLTVSDIALAYQIPREQLLAANDILHPRRIQAGLELFIPDRGPLPVDRARQLERRQRARVIRSPRGSFGRPLEINGRLVVAGRFGHRLNPLSGEPQQHTGIDFAAPWGTPILAARDGVVAWAGIKGGYGKLVIIRHDHGWETYYGHTTEYFVREGETVVEGQVIARVGSTGDSTAPHLHFEVRLDGNPRNPERWMRRYF